MALFFTLPLYTVKKTASILLLFVYSCSFVCLGYNLHFCGGHLKSVSLVKSVKDGCSSKKQMPDGCCKDVFLKCKAGDQSLAKFILLSIVKVDVPTAILATNYPSLVYQSPLLISHCLIGEPPDKPTLHLYLRNRCLLI